MHEQRGTTANIVVINVQEDPSAAARFAQQYGWRFPVGLDTDGRVADSFGVSGIPATFVIDARGSIVDTIIGAADEERFLQALDRAAGG